MGYVVWSDITKLFGAEIFWDDIEDAIRNHAAKVVAVLSKAALIKNGVLDEINLAIRLERNENRKYFTVPIRIDDFNYDDVKISLSRINIIDFHGNWFNGLMDLLKVFERDNTPKEQSRNSLEISSWLRDLRQGAQSISSTPQNLLSNWFPIEQLPDRLNFFIVPINMDSIPSRFNDFAYPWFQYQDMLATFASNDDVDSHLTKWQRATKGPSFDTISYLSARDVSLKGLDWQTTSRHLVDLVRKAWDKNMQAKKLLPYELSGGRKAWYYPNERIPGNWATCHDLTGKERKKKLVGRSIKRQIYWHFATQAYPKFGKVRCLGLKPHVIFTTDGNASAKDAKSMHILRRGFCRSWWNDRWRDLMLAFVELLADSDGLIRLRTGSESQIILNSRPLVYESPVSITGIEAEQVLEDETDIDYGDYEDEFSPHEDDGISADDDDVGKDNE